MIFDSWLDMPVWGIFGSVAGLFALTAILIHWLCFGKACRTRAANFSGVVAPFFGSVAVLFALLTGFLANDVWERNRQATRTVMAEEGGLLTLYAVSVATVSDMKDIRATAQRYAELLISDEWPRMRDQDYSAKAGQTLLELLSKVADPKITADAGPAAQGALLDVVLKLRSARDDRLALSGDRTDRTKWAAVVILALITQIAIAVVHLERPRAQIAALSIFSVAVVVALGFVAMRERPFDGPLQLSPAPLQEVLQVYTGVLAP
ncbi:bestrophin-like domain [Microvirga alba]|uniref:DUF4239 domain-containing protein n=1 Tax=Microvirga alba TaxID=2791025 RepID=A0A931BS00_9HYPH|nr:DUF4239 domain-containing protein [Microvirga alba]MBF9232705.1 DUF4239 domain-containing protein [Microvirga alba]